MSKIGRLYGIIGFWQKKIKSGLKENGTTFKYPKFIEKPKKSDAICMISK